MFRLRFRITEVIEEMDFMYNLNIRFLTTALLKLSRWVPIDPISIRTLQIQIIKEVIKIKYVNKLDFQLF